MAKSDLHPPLDGLSADPVLFGVAAGLADLFPPIHLGVPAVGEREAERDADRDPRDED